ncbi:MAG: alpha/beta hydrolase [Gemmatimonadales bacterium]
MSHPLLELGGRGPVLHWSPANGFPLETYRPILDRLASRYRSVAIPPRALWPDAGDPPAELGSWADNGTDIVAGLAEHGIQEAILVGHSFGAVASLVAAVRHRRAVRALVMLDPTIFPPAIMDRIRLAKAAGWNPPHPLAGRTRERRRAFATHEEAFEFWRGKPLFADWSDDALGRYVESILRPADGGFELRWTPEWEAYDYECFYPDAWTEAAALDPELETLLVYGEDSDTFGAESAAHFRRVAPSATLVAVPRAGHLFPQARPAETATIVSRWLAEFDPDD